MKSFRCVTWFRFDLLNPELSQPPVPGLATAIQRRFANIFEYDPIFTHGSSDSETDGGGIATASEIPAPLVIGRATNLRSRQSQGVS
ncbi:MAG: hypothetical protein AAGI69_04240 [Cyanobacteria bacterium P01_H01_bin.21]